MKAVARLHGKQERVSLCSVRTQHGRWLQQVPHHSHAMITRKIDFCMTEYSMKLMSRNYATKVVTLRTTTITAVVIIMNHGGWSLKVNTHPQCQALQSK
jgi:hypothetical protein